MNYPACPCCGGQNATLNANNQYCCNYCGHVYSAAANNTQNQSNSANPAQPYASKDKLVTGLLGIFLGCYGAHYFYLGKTTQGVIFLLVTILSGLFLYWIPALIGLIEGIMILTQDDNDFKQQPKIFFK